MKYLAFILGVFFSEKIFSQNVIETIWNEELAFAKMAKEVGTKPAFLHFLATDAIIFDENGAKIGLDSWKNNNFTGRLEWQPKFLKISSEKDIAYTVGHYQYFSEGAQPIGRGIFVSIWQKQADNNWKVKLDIGSGFLGEQTPKLVDQKIQLSKKYSLNDTSSIKAAILTSDYLLSTNLNKGRKVDAFTTDCQFIQNQGIKASGFRPIDAIVSQSQDLAFVYGQIELPTKTNYLRIWERQNRKTWKVVLELISN